MLPVPCAYHRHEASSISQKLGDSTEIRVWPHDTCTRATKELITRFSSQQSYSVYIKATATMCMCPTTEGNVLNTETWFKLRFSFGPVQQNKHCNSRTQSEVEGLIKCCNKTVFNGQSLFQCTSRQTGIKLGDNFLRILEQNNHIPAGLVLCQGYVNW